MCSGFKAEALATYIHGNAYVDIKFRRPLDKGKILVTAVSVAGAVVATVTAWPVVRVILGRPYLWSFATMVRCFLPLRTVTRNADCPLPPPPSPSPTLL